MLDAVNTPVLSLVVLRTGGTEYRIVRFVKRDPSQMCLPYTVPVEIVEKKP